MYRLSAMGFGTMTMMTDRIEMDGWMCACVLWVEAHLRRQLNKHFVSHH